jgi:hypothetical protein
MARPSREGGYDLDPRGGQPEHVVECLQVLADIGASVAWRGAGGRGKDRHGFAAAVDPAVKQGLDAIRDPQLVRGIAGGLVDGLHRAAGNRAGAGRHGRGRAGCRGGPGGDRGARARRTRAA